MPELADQLTWTGRLDQAIALYRETADTNDELAQRRALIGLARALSWAGDHTAAIATYDQLLARFPDDREARLGRATVLSWSNRQAAALAEYRAILTAFPLDMDARRGVGRVQSWRGRYRYAATDMQALLEEQAGDREATVILAESLAWMGRQDRAKPVLRDHLAVDPRNERATALLAELDRAQRPEVQIDWREFRQSDDLRISQHSATTRVHLADGRGHFGPRYSLGLFKPDQPPVEEIQVQRPGIDARFRFSDALEGHASVAADLIDTKGADGDHQIMTWDSYLTYWPNDTLRLDAGTSRWTFDSEAALVAGLKATQLSASADLLPDELTRWSARASAADYSDDNQRIWWQLQADRRVMHTPRVAIGYRYTGFEFQNPGQPGYYNPDRYQANELLVHASGRLNDRLRWHFSAVAGHESEDTGESRATASAGASLTWEASHAFELELAFDYSSSRTSSASGFERSIGRVTLRRRFGSN
ncbi:MAG: tetratricopeptide repeat protein [Gammaproteobacteria bacterium]|nr:tetratricopeptide repeat protein [Gammaproteobacteria bacterium]